MSNAATQATTVKLRFDDAVSQLVQALHEACEAAKRNDLKGVCSAAVTAGLQAVRVQFLAGVVLHTQPDQEGEAH